MTKKDNIFKGKYLLNVRDQRISGMFKDAVRMFLLLVLNMYLVITMTKKKMDKVNPISSYLKMIYNDFREPNIKIPVQVS